MTIEERLAALEKRIEELEGKPVQASKKKQSSLREFINTIKPKTANDTALVIGYYQESVLLQPFFTSDSLKAGFKEAKIAPPKNFSDVVAQNAKKGYFMPSDDSNGKVKTWVLTNTGEEIISEMQQNNG